jgi:osmoprotectant transport system substrate-binding protein
VSLVAGLSLVMSGAACAADSEDAGGGTGPLAAATVTVGSKDFDEQLILGQITVLALKHAGAKVKDQTNLGGTNVARAALISGKIDVYWDYTGTAWVSFFHKTTPISDRTQQWQAVHDIDLKDNNLVWMQAAPFNNTYGIAYSSKIAGKLGSPKTLSDLGALSTRSAKDATLCVESEFSTRDDGLPGMNKAYGYQTPKGNVTVLDTGIIYTSTDKHDPCNFGEVFTTDGRIKALGLTVLEDDKHFFPLYNAAPVFRGQFFNDHGPALTAIFDPIAQALTQDVMTELNRQVSVEGQRPAQVAKRWLTEKGLLAG